MSLSDSKKQELFNYYSENGFQHPTEQIVKKMHICHKTFFNRYGTKSNSVEIAWQYWQQICRQKWEEMSVHCNHSIELLAMTLYAIEQTREADPYFYAYTKSSRKYLEKDSFFYSTLYSVLEMGKQHFHVQEGLNIDLYLNFLLHNLFLIEVPVELRSEILRFVLTPSLTELGMELFNETPFSW